MAYSLALIILLGLAADRVFRRIGLPGLIGMLLAGVLAGPGGLDILSPDMMRISADLRRIALIVILLRAGLELHRDTLNRVGFAAILMSSIPTLFEIGGVMLAAPPLLHITHLEAAILGAILSAVSPAVVVPQMIEFMERGRGVKKGTCTLVLGASSLNDVFAIVLFTVFLGMYGGNEANVWVSLAEIPLSMVLGTLLGLAPGFILLRLFQRYDWRSPKRTIAVLAVAILLTWIEEISRNFLPVASLLGVMAIGFIILEKAEPIAHIISLRLKKLWVFADLLVFVLVGAQVDIETAWNAGLAGAGVIAVGLVFRSVGTWLSLLGTSLNRGEKLFCTIAYIPKATVQAAIGAIPLASGVASGEVILAVAVLSILITSPVGALGTAFVGERALDYGEKSIYRFRELRDKLGLPHVGERVRNKRRGTVWKVIEEKEEWMEESRASSSPEQAPAVVPTISLRYWKEGSGVSPGKGKTRSYRYSQKDRPFADTWETIYDW